MSKAPYENPPSYNEAMYSTPQMATGIIQEMQSHQVSGPPAPMMSQYSMGGGMNTVQTSQPTMYSPYPGMAAPPNMYPQMPSAPPHGFQPSYGATDMRTTVITTEPQIIVIGGCPNCRIGVLEDDYTCCGICCAIFFFPIGVLCCLAMKQKRCSNCGAEF